MNSKNTFYTKGYKYRTAETIVYQTTIRPEKEITSDAGMIQVTREGLLIIRSGYSSDGPSGITFDTDNFMMGAFVHDALYELLRQGKFDNMQVYDENKQRLSHEDVRKISDIALRDICRSMGMSKFRSWYVYKGVRKGGFSSASVKRKIHKA